MSVEDLFGGDDWDGSEHRRNARDRKRRERAKAKAEKDAETADWIAKLDERAGPPVPADAPGPVQAQALGKWAAATLVVPAGHPRAGDPMSLPAFASRWLGGALGDHRTALLSTARKNAKSAICAVLALGMLSGPLRRPGARIAIASLNAAKAGELKIQIEGIAEASGIEGLTFRRSRLPSVESVHGVSLDVLAADRGSGHASGYDLVLVDETGLMRERDREYLTGLATSVSAREGRTLHISVLGDGPFIPELRERPDVFSTVYEPAGDVDDLTDRAAWAAANPGLGTIKSARYMHDQARAAIAVPSGEPGFRTYDLNQPTNARSQTICTPRDWRDCEVDDLPARSGPCVIGLDIGGSSSMTAAVVIWPDTWRMEVYAAFPPAPELADRGRGDGKGPDFYQRAVDRGELELLGAEGQRTTPVDEFLARLAVRLEGQRIAALAADRYRRSEVQDALRLSAARWPAPIWRGTGAGRAADGSADVRAFQRITLAHRPRCRPSLLMRDAIGYSSIRFDSGGNPALTKTSSLQRIDVLQAGVIAAGLAERWLADRPKPLKIALA